MALYPSIFVLYLGKLNPALTSDWHGYAWSLAVVVVCCVWNLRGAPAVGEDAVGLFALLVAPFVVFVILGLWRGFTLHPNIHWNQPGSGIGAGISTAILVAMWNYMGWDNASTIAQEVENPQRNYPRAMILSTFLVAVTYILPLAAMAMAGLSAEGFSTGDWATAAKALGGAGLLGTLLGLAVIAGGAISGVGMFNALVMSYSRLPMAMAQDGMLPRLVARRNRRQVPWVSVLLCGVAWALALKLPFERLISIDLILYGTSLLLEFVALVALRIREPGLPRPFKAGNMAFAILLGVGPTVLIVYALYVSRRETLFGTTSALLFSVAVALLGPVLYWVAAAPLARRRLSASSTE